VSLSPADVSLVRAFTAAVVGRFDVLRAEHARELAEHGALTRRWREMLLQVHVFAGFPRLVEVHQLLGADGALAPDEREAELGADEVRARGRALFDTIYANDADDVRGMLARSHADFAAWIEEHAYGRVLARPGLAADRRELLVVGALAALGQERQLASHARGAVRCGARTEEVSAALDAIAELLPSERLARARDIVTRFARG
jgi:alkylhydroperoxidase/carboxymuconolactone decarboxylase family protein YurZ